jgi:hypothetical protein
MSRYTRNFDFLSVAEKFGADTLSERCPGVGTLLLKCSISRSGGETNLSHLGHITVGFPICLTTLFMNRWSSCDFSLRRFMTSDDS